MARLFSLQSLALERKSNFTHFFIFLGRKWEKVEGEEAKEDLLLGSLQEQEAQEAERDLIVDAESQGGGDQQYPHQEEKAFNGDDLQLVDGKKLHQSEEKSAILWVLNAVHLVF